MKNYPELRCYRDVAFYWKFFLNTDIKSFPNYSNPDNRRELAPFDRMAGILSFQWDDRTASYTVKKHFFFFELLILNIVVLCIDNLLGECLVDEFAL